MEKSEIMFEFDSNSENESLARTVVAAFLARLDPTLEELGDVKTAVSEAVTNAIIHGYDGKPGKVKIHSWIEENTIWIEVADQGVGIGDVNRAMEPLFTTSRKWNVPEWALLSWKLSWMSCMWSHRWGREQRFV